MMTAWLMGATMAACFAAIPLIMLYHQPTGRPLRISVIVFCLSISVFSAALSLWLVWHAICTIHIVVQGNALDIRRTVLGIGLTHTFSHVNHITVVRQWHHRKRGGRHEEEVLVVHTEAGHQWVSSTMESRNLAELFDWLRDHTEIKCIDARSRDPLG